MALENSLDLLLVLLYAKGASSKHGEKIKGFTRLQKLFFLLWKEADFGDLVLKLDEFEAYNYGPFSSSLYDDIVFAESIGLIKTTHEKPEFKLENVDEREFIKHFLETEGIDIDSEDLDQDSLRKDFVLTPEGENVAKEIWKELDNQTKQRITSIKTRYNSKPFMELIRIVYSKYPEYAKKSIMVL